MYKDFNSKLSLQGEIENVYDINAIKNSITNIISTRRGSIPGKPYFGSELHLVVFEQLDNVTTKMAERYVWEAISKFEDRIILENVNVIKNEEFNRIVIAIDFRYKHNINSNSESVSIPINL